MKNIFFKAGRFLYRLLGCSANQRITMRYKLSVKNINDSNDMIYKMLTAKKPVMISRFGTPESKCILNYLEIKKRKNKGFFDLISAQFEGNIDYWRDDVRQDMEDLVGFFPTTDEMLEKFSAFYIEQIKKVDAIGIWRFVPGEAYLVNKFCAMATTYDPLALEPYFFNEPWSRALENQKVLIIHPFADTILTQFEKRQNLFLNKKILPDFDIKTVKAVQSIAGTKTEFSDWFEALSHMQEEINKIEFDIAIIGAGCYGLPLAAYVKEMGKKAVHIGGATQILFGIKGKRWDEDSNVSKFYNEYWVRPALSEIVPQGQKVEGGCYW